MNRLCAQRSGIHARWDALLRTERVTSPLAYPDALTHLIEWALDQLFIALREPASQRKAEHATRRPATRPECLCGKNPLLAFFRAGEQAMLEALVLEQAAHRPVDPHDRDLAVTELNYAIRAMARTEIEAFCSVCQHRTAPSPAARPKASIPVAGKSGGADIAERSLRHSLGYLPLRSEPCSRSR